MTLKSPNQICKTLDKFCNSEFRLVSKVGLKLKAAVCEIILCKSVGA